MTTDYKSVIEKYHTSAYGYISEALKIDEACDGVEKKMNALRLYKKGVDELKKGLNMQQKNIKVTDPTSSKTERLREKMSKNLIMANDRIADLEKFIRESQTRKNSGLKNMLNLKAKTVPRTASSASSTPTRNKSPPANYNKLNLNSKMMQKPTELETKTVGAVKKLKGLDANLANLILDQILETRCSISFSDIAGLKQAKDALKETIILPMLKPELFTGLRSPVQGILLFGPPGNGKTMLARAVASESKCIFFNISASTLTSKWVGEAEKLVKALFTLARELQPAIIFIDEVDSILCERNEKENESSRRLKTEFLLQFDGVSSSSDDRILIIGATNRPQDLDDAILRRFPKRIYIGLPDFDGRKELIEKLLARHNNPLRLRDLEAISRQTDEYSNFDLTQLAKEAAMGPVRDINPDQLVHFNADELRSISLYDFQNALGKIRPSCKPDLMKSLLKFNEQFGAC